MKQHTAAACLSQVHRTQWIERTGQCCKHVAVIIPPRLPSHRPSISFYCFPFRQFSLVYTPATEGLNVSRPVCIYTLQSARCLFIHTLELPLDLPILCSFLLRHLLSARSCTDTRAESMVPKHLLRNTIVLLILFKLPFFSPPAPAPAPAPSFVSRRYTIEMVDGSDILTKAVRLVEDLGLVCTQLFGPNSKPFKRGEGAGRGAASRGVPQRAPKVCSLAMVTYVCYANKPTSSHAACPLISPL